MRNIVTFRPCVLAISAACVWVQAAAAQSGSLKAAVERYGVRAVRALSEGSGESYAVYETKTFHGDLDRDGDADAVVELSFCKPPGCEPVTQTSNIAVFLKSRRGYRFAAGAGFLKFNEDNSTELTGRVESVRGRKIYVAVYGCEVDDEVCLPRFLYRAVYSLRRGGLVMERAYARGSQPVRTVEP